MGNVEPSNIPHDEPLLASPTSLRIAFLIPNVLAYDADLAVKPRLRATIDGEVGVRLLLYATKDAEDQPLDSFLLTPDA